MTDGAVATCSCCGTVYSERAWAWLHARGVQHFGAMGIPALDLRQCAVPGCHNTLARPLVRAVVMARGIAANDAG